VEQIRIFISSVQNEFLLERAKLFDYIRQDALLGQFFEPFTFECTEAKDKSAQKVYLEQVRACNIYLGIFGEKYGFENEKGVSPTKKEYDLATELYKMRLIFIKNAPCLSVLSHLNLIKGDKVTNVAIL
jgi:hypothetical protein